MIYQIYSNGILVSCSYSFEDAMFFIWDGDLSIIEECEDLEENVIKLYCEDKD